jgi:hypothetical protein
MPRIFKTLINVSVWMLFFKGCLAVVITLYTTFGALIDGETVPMVAWVGCLAGAFAFTMSCVAAWIRQKVE